MTRRRWPWSRRPEVAAATPEWAPASWPKDSQTVERWVREALVAPLHADADDAPDAERVRIVGLDGIRIQTQLHGADLTRLLIDATGVDLTVRAPARVYTYRDLDPGPPPPASEAPRIISRAPGTLHSARIVAQPVRVQGHAVNIDLTLANIGLDWVRYDRERTAGVPASIVDVEAADAPTRPSGAFTVRMRADQLAPLVADVARPLLAALGVRLRHLTGTVTVSRRQVVTVRGAAAVRWKIFGASVRLLASVHISPDAVVTVRRLRLRSVNPIVAIALAATRSGLRAVEGQVHDLNAALREDGAATPRLHDVRIAADRDLTASGRFS